jgi:hypothetical protein
MAPAVLLKWARETPWSEAIVRAWRQALTYAPDPAWCEAFLDDWPRTLLHEDPAPVLALLPPARREKYWLQQLDGGGRRSARGDVVFQLLAGTPFDDNLSAGLSRRLVDMLGEALQAEDGVDWTLRDRLPELAAALAPDRAAALAVAALHPDAPPTLREAQATAQRVVEVRRALGF